LLGSDVAIVEAVEEFPDLSMLGVTRMELEVVDLLTSCALDVEGALKVVKLWAANEEVTSPLANGTLEMLEVDSVMKLAVLGEGLAEVELFINGALVVILETVEGASEVTKVEVVGEVSGVEKL